MTTTKYPAPRPGMTLPNGAVVLKVKRAEQWDNWILLAKWMMGDRIEYVTWWCNSNSLNTWWGHYSGDYDAAVKDYNQRK